MDIQEYVTYRLGIWEQVKSDTARIISTELLLMRHKLTKNDGLNGSINNKKSI
jgi:hypothetical protein